MSMYGEAPCEGCGHGYRRHSPDGSYCGECAGTCLYIPSHTHALRRLKDAVLATAPARIADPHPDATEDVELRAAILEAEDALSDEWPPPSWSLDL